MEDGLVPRLQERKWFYRVSVLILIVVEDGLILPVKADKGYTLKVLILIVMEEGLVPSVFMGHTCEECAS